MDSACVNGLSLDIPTRDLTAALKHLIKAERKEQVLWLSYQSGSLTISLGKASREIGATGSWSQPVSVIRTWAETLANNPYEAAIITIRVREQKLCTRDFVVPCSLGTDAEANEELIRREKTVDAVCRTLLIYNVTREDVNLLIDNGDSSVAQLWGSGDGELVAHVAEAWTEMASIGVRTSDIRRLFNRKIRGSFGSPKRVTDTYGPLARYHVSTQEKNDLIQSGNTGDGKQWESVGHRVIHDAITAWKCLALYGVEPIQILSVMTRRP